MHRCIWSVVAVLVLAAASPAGATFPGENGALVFSGVDTVSHTVQVYRMAPGGAVPTRLTAPSGEVFNECPSWSADGRLIYFDSLDRSTTNPAHIYRINETGGSRTLVDSSNAPTDLCPRRPERDTDRGDRVRGRRQRGDRPHERRRQQPTDRRRGSGESGQLRPALRTHGLSHPV
jgi:hypothetical protein